MSFRAHDGVKKSNANRQKQKGDSWAPMTQLDLASGTDGSRVHLCSLSGPRF